MEVLFPMEKLAVRGLVEVLRHYFEIVGIRRRLQRYFLREKPALFIGIDSPDFNLDLEAALKQGGIPTVQYVGPTIWAWRRERIHKVKRATSLVLTLYPFEPPLYERARVPVCYVGHPLADLLAHLPTMQAVREEFEPQSIEVFEALKEGASVEQAAQRFGLSVAAVYKVKQRVRERLRERIAQQIAAEDPVDA